MKPAEAGRAQAAGIVLAAGRSLRFGRDKRLEVVAGQPMLLRAAKLLGQALPDTLVVLGPEDAALAEQLAQQGVCSTLCPDARAGMGRSLAHAVTQRADASGWLIMPADLPFLQAATVQAVLDAARGHDLVAPAYHGQRGHPVWFSQRFRQALCALDGDEGGRSVLRAHAREALCQVEVQDQGCVRDIDTPQDMAPGA